MKICEQCGQSLPPMTPVPMSKQKAIETFGRASDLARVLDCTRSAITQWPDPLPARIADRVLAACVRSGIDPAPLLDDGDLRDAA